MVSLVSGRGSDHERWLNTQLETVGVACEGWFGSEVAADVPQKFKLVDVEKMRATTQRQVRGRLRRALARAPARRAGRDGAVSTGAEREAHRRAARVYAALGLLDAFDRGDVSLSRALVDYVLVVLDAGRRSLVVIDAKASRKVKLEHQIQVAAYTMLIDVAFGRTDFMATAPGVCRVGGVWLPAKASPQIFEVGGLQKKVRELLATKVTDLLTADAHARDFDTDTDDWVLRGSCESCNFRASCEKQAADRGRLCALPGLRADDAVELQNFSAGAAGRNRHRAARDGRPDGGSQHHHEEHAPGARARDPSPVRGRRAASELPPTLRAWRENAIVPTGRPSASLPYLHAEEVARVCICVDEHFRSRAPMAFVVASAPHHGALSQRSRVVDYAPFAGDAHANAAVNTRAPRGIELVMRGLRGPPPVQRTTRLRLCSGSGRQVRALRRGPAHRHGERDVRCRARRARLVIATLGAEPAHLLLAGNCPTLGDEAREAHQFLPRCSVLVEEAKRLFAVPSVRATTFEDCCAHLPRDGDLRADADECSREAVFRDWALLGPGQLKGVVSSDVIKSRCKTLLERRASLGLALLAGIRACCRGGAATPTTTQDMDVEDIAAGRQFPLLPFKAARVRLTEEGRPQPFRSIGDSASSPRLEQLEDVGDDLRVAGPAEPPPRRTDC